MSVRTSKTPQTYEAALKRPSRRIWPGCGDGRERWCGRIHDCSYTVYTGMNTSELVHDFRCAYNYHHGCPTPIPKPGEAAPGVVE